MSYCYSPLLHLRATGPTGDFALDLAAVLAATAPAASALTLLTTALLLGIRHGIDWDHIAAITDITSTTAVAEAGDERHVAEHLAGAQLHTHGGPDEMKAHAAAAILVPPNPGSIRLTRGRFLSEQRRAMLLGTLYALGHATVVAALGILALVFGALLPDWVDPIMGRVVGVTLIVLGLWVFYSLYAYFRHGTQFRLRSRWMVVFGSVRYAWHWFRAKLHGHDHVEQVEMSAYGPRTAFGVGMIHGVGAETGSQVLIIAAVGGAASVGLGIPMMVAFIIGLLISNSVIVFVSATGFVASQLRNRIYLVIGMLAGTFSLVVGVLFLLGAEGALPDLNDLVGYLGGGS
jgi:cytochrome c biogenesis protein CcdA